MDEKTTITITVSWSLRQRLDHYADELNVTKSVLCTQILSRACDDLEDLLAVVAEASRQGRSEHEIENLLSVGLERILKVGK